MFRTIQKDLGQFKTLPSQRKATIILLIGLLFIASVVVGSLLTGGSKKVDEQPTTGTDATTQPETRPSTALALVPNEATLKIGASQKIEVTLSRIPVAAADIVLSFDPAVFDVSGVTNGTVFSNVIVNKVDTTAGEIKFSASVSPSKKDDLKEGTVFSFTVKAKKEAASSALDFVKREKDGTITALNGENTLGVTNGALLKVTK
ncbi:MAG: Cohesin domain protein [Microgenomates bacterium OLB22]|nr:MAG: Cohesin domain protein [Microgenomates bacterium OLB22]